ncbi:uncharacterized protein [Macrobrachium rosenbergii]|uniref:uncharacterized protein n=1 Tax=Macrobrachium rosenbergii TaxID=79674 RepID=UPI0034D5FDF3
MVDRSRRWSEATLVKDASSAACASAFLSSWVSRFGVPDHITSHRGTTFTLQLWISLNCPLGTQLHHTSGYHPESNGIFKRFHCTLKAALMSHCNSLTWYPQLPWVLLGLRTTPKGSLDLTAAEMVYAAPLVIPCEFFTDNNTSPDIVRLHTIVGKFAPTCPSHKPNDKTCIPKDQHITTLVFIRTNAV